MIPCLARDDLARLALEGRSVAPRTPEPPDERDHLARCARCRAAVDDMADLASVLARPPAGAPDVDLVAGVLQRAALPPARRRAPLATLAAVAAAAAALALVTRVPSPTAPLASIAPLASVTPLTSIPVDPGGDPEGPVDPSFHARGAAARDDAAGSSRWAALRVYRAAAAEPPAALPRQHGTLRPGDALLLAYDNDGPRPFRYLHAFAAERHVTPYRLHDLYPESGAASTAIPIEPGRAHELREELHVPVDSDELTVFAIFSHAPLDRALLDAARRSLALGTMDFMRLLPRDVALDSMSVSVAPPAPRARRAPLAPPATERPRAR